jgi:hypothetical protein
MAETHKFGSTEMEKPTLVLTNVCWFLLFLNADRVYSYQRKSVSDKRLLQLGSSTDIPSKEVNATALLTLVTVRKQVEPSQLYSDDRQSE